MTNVEVFAEEGTIAPADLELFKSVETAEEAWAAIQRCYEGRMKAADVEPDRRHR